MMDEKYVDIYGVMIDISIYKVRDTSTFYKIYVMSNVLESTFVTEINLNNNREEEPYLLLLEAAAGTDPKEGQLSPHIHLIGAW